MSDKNTVLTLLMLAVIMLSIILTAINVRGYQIVKELKETNRLLQKLEEK